MKIYNILLFLFTVLAFKIIFPMTDSKATAGNEYGQQLLQGIRTHNVDLVKFALDNKANPNGLGLMDFSPLCLVIHCGGLPQIFETLLEFGADVDYSFKPVNLSPLHVAACKSLFYVEELLKAKANYDNQDCFGNTALHIAAGDPKRKDIVKVLLDAGADYRIKNKDEIAPKNDLINDNKILRETNLAHLPQWLVEQGLFPAPIAKMITDYAFGFREKKKAPVTDN